MMSLWWLSRRFLEICDESHTNRHLRAANVRGGGAWGRGTLVGKGVRPGGCGAFFVMGAALCCGGRACGAMELAVGAGCGALGFCDCAICGADDHRRLSDPHRD